MNELQQRIFSVKQEDAPAASQERRREPRMQIARPVYVQPATPGAEQFEELRTMRDFSRNGFYFLTERDSYRPGVHLHVIPAFGCLNLEYLGEVVRVDRLPSGEYGVAVRLLQVANLGANARTPTLSAFQAFALADCTPTGLSHGNS